MPATGASTVANLSFQQLENLWTQYGGNPVYAPMAAAVALAESGGNPNAKNVNTGGSVDYGLWQINSKWNGGSPADYDPATNVRKAISISKNGTTWRSWCSAYSDNRCGDRGGTYLGDGANALKRLAANGGGSTGNAPAGGANSGSATTAINPLSNTVDEVFSYIARYAIALVGVVLIIFALLLVFRWMRSDEAPKVSTLIRNFIVPGAANAAPQTGAVSAGTGDGGGPVASGSATSSNVIEGEVVSSEIVPVVA